MKQKWRKGGLPTDVIRFANGYSAVVGPTHGGYWYGLCTAKPVKCFFTSELRAGWSERKTKRKALKHLFRLPKRN